MKYKCLVLDHDDTVVNSSQSIHYPAFLHTLETLRPNIEPLSFSDFNHHCFVYGFEHLCKIRYQFNDEEMLIEYKIWKSHTQTKQAQPFNGWKELLDSFRNNGGKIVVVSYSESKEIIRDYKDHFGFEPDLVFAYDQGPDNLKPHTYPIRTLINVLNIKSHEILVIDDMPVGYEMAKKAHVDFIWAQWAYFDETLNEHIIKTSNKACLNVEELFEILELIII